MIARGQQSSCLNVSEDKGEFNTELQMVLLVKLPQK